MSSRIPKKYPRSIAHVVKEAERVESNLILHKAEFQRRYSSVFTEAFIEALSALIRKIRSLPSDIAMRGNLAAQTAALHKILKRFDALYTELIASVENAFSDRPVIMTQFGIDRKSEIDISRAALLTFIDDFKSLWELHSAVLLAAGCSPTLPEDFAALENDCVIQTNMQSMAKNNRQAMTDTRQETANLLWFNLKKTEKHANAIFGIGSPEAAHFKLDYGSRKTKADAPAPKAKKNAAPASADEPDLSGAGPGAHPLKAEDIVSEL